MGSGAAIGGCDSSNGGTISISGGIINATTNGSLCAAIGGYDSSTGGTITISGGKITATGEFTGIGAGKNCSETASTTVTIGLTDAEDYIYINSYNCGKVVVASTSQSLKQQADGGNVYAPNAEITDLSAINGQKLMVYAGETHTITFDSDGGSSVNSQQVSNGGTATQPENPVKVGYSFAGWTLGGSPYDFSTAVTGDITLTATWASVSAIDYIGSTGSMVNTSSYAPVYEGMTKMNVADAAVWVAGSDMTISNRITVTGNISLILTDGATLKATKGFTVQDGNSLTIYGQTNGTGVLYAGTTDFSDQTAEDEYAAIGGERNNAGGTFTIYGGTVYAVGGYTAAAIGGGREGAGGTINIHGGTVNAEGGSNAASLGGGIDGAGGIISIDGGSVNVDSRARSSYGAGIGGGRLGGAGTILISGGTVIAHATYGAAIGNGESSREGDQGSIIISGGTVQAESSATGCAAIGAGVTAICPNITISGGTVNTDCIGEDSRNNYIRSVGSTITISGGNITADHIGIKGNSPTTSNMTISLSWTNETDQIKVKGFSGNLVTAAPKLYKVSDTGTIATNDVLSAINSETTLVPLTAITLANDASNSDILATTNGVTGLNVTLQGRTLFKDGSWNTLCLPFDVTTESGTLSGDGVQAMTLDTSSSNLADGKLTLNFDAATTIPAGTPFIIKWDNTGVNIENPVFEGVTIDAEKHDATVEDVLTFTGTYAPVSIADGGDNTKLYLGSANTLYYPNAAMTIGTHRAYFQLSDGLKAGSISQARLFFGDGEQAAIEQIAERLSSNSQSGLYSLDGRKLVGMPTARSAEGRLLPKGLKKGIYVINGKKVVIK